MANMNPTNIGALFNQAHDNGELSNAALQALSIDADIGAQIQAGLGIAPDDVPSSEVILVSIMPDDSGSIQQFGNAELVRQGHNIVLDALKKAKHKDGVLVHCRYLNGFVLYPYVLLDQAVEMDRSNYDPNMGTPLYDQTAVLLGTVLAKTLEFEQSGVPVRTVSLIISDGADAGSTRQSPKSVRGIVEDMLRKENHIIAAMGIDDGYTDFRAVFGQMGIQNQWILTTKNTDREIRKAFQLFSQSAIRASAGAAGFRQSLAGGFAVP